MHKELKGWLEFLGFDEPVELTQLHGDEKTSTLPPIKTNQDIKIVG